MLYFILYEIRCLILRQSVPQLVVKILVHCCKWPGTISLTWCDRTVEFSQFQWGHDKAFARSSRRLWAIEAKLTELMFLVRRQGGLLEHALKVCFSHCFYFRQRLFSLIRRLFRTACSVWVLRHRWYFRSIMTKLCRDSQKAAPAINLGQIILILLHRLCCTFKGYLRPVFLFFFSVHSECLR